MKNDHRVVIQRRFLVYRFAVITSAPPGRAAGLIRQAVIASGASVAGDISESMLIPKLAGDLPRPFASAVNISLTPSVAGSTVRVAVITPAAWWLAFALLTAAVVFTAGLCRVAREGCPAFVLCLAVLFAVITVRLRAHERAKRLVLQSTPA